jgi:hypothetical protein
MNTTQLSAHQAVMIAERLLDPERVLAAVPTCLQSLAGTALLHARLAPVSPVFEAAVRSHWTAAATHTPRTAHPGVFAAPGGMAASMILGQTYLTDPEPQRAAAQQAVRWLSAQAADKAAAHHDGLRRGEAAASWELYDVITGLTGTGRMLLAALASGHDHAEQGLIATLNTLTTMINNPRGDGRPGWWLPAADHPADYPAGVPPSGVAETGMAHGIAGPLALLSIAASGGWTVDGQTTAIRTAANWLSTWRTPGTNTWPPHITGAELDSGQPAPAAGRRDAWCYGTPGISRALTLAGQALADPRLAQTGDTAIMSMADRPERLWDTEGPTLCHGNAGVLQCAATSHAVTAALAASDVTAQFNTQHAFGFQHLRGGAASDDPGLLTGAAGIALALADHGDLPAPTTPTRWDAVLLLS